MGEEILIELRNCPLADHIGEHVPTPFEYTVSMPPSQYIEEQEAILADQRAAEADARTHSTPESGPRPVLLRLQWALIVQLVLRGELVAST